MENLYKNFIKIDIMSDLNLENIVGFKAVDKDGNEQNVTVDEMVDMVSTRMVMALSETSTFAAAAATGNDVYENELPTVTDAANVRVLQSSGDAAKMTMQSLASKLGELIGINETWFRNRGNIRGEINLDDFKNAGAYSLFNVEGNNVPTSWAQLLIFSSGYYIIQIIVDISSRKLFIRRYDTENDRWQEWGNIIIT